MNEKQLDLRSQIKILDVGAGTGRYSVPLAEEGYDAVSYTHLDVYKRQIVGSAIIKIIDEYGEASPKHVGEYVKAMKDAL